MDLNTLKWSEYMLKEFGIREDCLAEIRLSSSDDYGKVSTVECLKDLPITGYVLFFLYLNRYRVIGDQ